MARQTIPTEGVFADVMTKIESNFGELYGGTAPTSSTTYYIDITNPPEGYAVCVGDGVTDNTAAFNAILDLATTLHSWVFVPLGTFIVSAFALSGRKGVVVFGIGSTVSLLKMKAGQNTNFCTVAGTDYSSDGCGLYRIGLDGNRDNQTGSYALLHISKVNKGCLFKEIYMQYGYDGLKVSPNPYAWQYLFDDFLIMHMDNCCIYGAGTDNSFSNIVLGNSTSHCWYLAGANIRVNNVKIYGSRAASGIFITGGRMQLTNIDCQESYMHGLHMQTAYDVVVNNLNCDNNGFNYVGYVYGTPPNPKTTIDSYGLMVESCLDCTITGYNFSNRNTLYRYGIGAYKVWNGTHSGNYSSKRIYIQLNHETNPGAEYISGTSKITFATDSITSTDRKFTGFNVGEQVAITGCTVNASNNKYATITGVADQVLTFAASTFTAGAETAAITIKGPKRSLDLSYDGIDFMVQKRKYIEKTASFILAPDEIGATIFINTASNITVTIPSVANCPDIKNGRMIDTVFVRQGAGTVTFAAESGVYVNAKGTAISVQYGSCRLIRRPSADDRWVNVGDLA